MKTENNDSGEASNPKRGIKKIMAISDEIMRE
jgi:hypothetical protein